MDQEKQQKQRTMKQNKALHKYCQELANELNACGVSMYVFSKDISVDHTMESVKSIWRAIAKAKFGKNSTADLTTIELQQVYEEVNRHISNFGIEMSWPSEENTDEYLNSYERN